MQKIFRNGRPDNTQVRSDERDLKKVEEKLRGIIVV